MPIIDLEMHIADISNQIRVLNLVSNVELRLSKSYITTN